MRSFMAIQKQMADTMKGKADNDKLIPQYLEKISNKNMSPDVNIGDLSIDLTPLNQKLEEMTVVHKTHYDEYKAREDVRVEREVEAFNDLHGSDVSETVTLKGVLNDDGTHKTIDIPQGHYKALKKVKYYEKEAEQLYDLEADNIAGNEMSTVEGSGVDLSIDSSVELKHITGQEFEENNAYRDW